MDNFEKIKTIWRSEKADTLPDSKEISKAIALYTQKQKRKMWGIMLMLLLTFLLMCLVVIYYKSAYISTRIGEVIIFIGIFFIFIVKFKSLKKINEQELQSNQAFLEDLRQQLQKRSKPNKYQLVAFFCLATGYALYLYEAVHTSLEKMLISYALFAVFLAGMWFIFRPYMEKRQKKKKKEIINTIEIINHQIQE